jgi:hypothetical protein
MTIIMCKNIVTIETVNYVTVYGGKRRHVKQLELNYVTSYEVNDSGIVSTIQSDTVHNFNHVK